MFVGVAISSTTFDRCFCDWCLCDRWFCEWGIVPCAYAVEELVPGVSSVIAVALLKS